MNKSQKALADELRTLLTDNSGSFSKGEASVIKKCCSKWLRKKRLHKGMYEALRGIGVRRLGLSHPLIAKLEPSEPPRPNHAELNRHPNAV